MQRRTGQPNLIGHLERYLGPVEGGWTHDDSGRPLAVPLGAFNDRPVSGAITISTLGLSGHVLQQASEPIRQELIFACWARDGVRNAPAMLAHLADRAIHTHHAFLRSEWDAFATPILEGTALTGLSLSIPLGFPSGFSMLEDAYAEAVVFVQVVPLTPADAACRNGLGASALERKWREEKADLLDLMRAS